MRWCVPQMETEALHLVGFNVGCATPCAFIRACCQSLGGQKLPIGGQRLQASPAEASDQALVYEQAFDLALYHADLFLVGSESVGVDASLVGAAAFVSACFTLRATTIPLRMACFLCRVPEPRARALICRMQHLHAQEFEKGPTLLVTELTTRIVFARYSGELVPSKPAALVPRAPPVTQREGVRVCWWCETRECAARHGAGQVEVVA